MVQTGEMKISAHEKSKLTGVLTSWLGSAPGAGFDTESLRGKGAMINIVEKTSMKGRTYSDITSVTPVMAGMEAQVPQASNFTIPGGSPAPAPAQPRGAVVQQPVQQPAQPDSTGNYHSNSRSTTDCSAGTNSNVFPTIFRTERSVLS